MSDHTWFRLNCSRDILAAMNDAARYNAEFEQIMRDALTDAERVQNRDREVIWKAWEKSFNRLAAFHSWSAEQRAAKKTYLLDRFWD